MQNIKLDGSTGCFIHRDKDGIHLEMVVNDNLGCKSGDYKTVKPEDCPTQYDYVIDISETTYITLVKCMLSLATREEFNKILLNPVDGACWEVTHRKTNKKQ